jgi:aryl-alcohol dehydrogenase-like predicted oxidoreductase
MPAGARLTTEERLANKYLTEENWSRIDRLRPFAAARGKSVLEVSMGWLLARPIVSSVIAGASRPEQVASNVEAGACTLTLQDLNEIDTLVSGSGAPTGLQVSTRAAPAVTH